MFKVFGMELTFRREVRFTKVDSHINKAFGEVIEFAVHQYYGRHYLNINYKTKSIRRESVSLYMILEWYIAAVFNIT